MTNDVLFVIALIVVSALSGGVAYGMFQVGTMAEFEKSKMYFAAAVLAFLAYIFIMAMILFAFGPEAKPPSTEAPGKAIFDACAKIVPPIVTLIIGFYFGATQDRAAPPSPLAPSPAATSPPVPALRE